MASASYLRSHQIKYNAVFSQQLFGEFLEAGIVLCIIIAGEIAELVGKAKLLNNIY